MFDADSFENILAIVRLCVASNRGDLIEPSLVDRQHVSAVMAKIEAERTARRPADQGRSSLDGPTPEQADALAEAVKRRFEAYSKGSD
jgi:hypothetical protein